jgi:aspartate/methionine/tyrosine aminotransferase
MFEQMQIFKWLRETARGDIKINMAGSGIPSVTPRELKLGIDDFLIYDTLNADKHYPRLREMLAERYRVPFDSIALSPAASGANFMVPAALLSRDDEVLSEQPYYEPQWRSAQAVCAKVNFFKRRPEENFAINPEVVKKAMTPKTRLVIVSNLHNPSMQFAGADELAAVAAIAAKNKAYLLVDEVYRELLFDEIPETAAKIGDNVVVTTSLSKALGLGGLRLGWALGAPGVIREVWKILDYMSVIVPTPCAHIIMHALKNEKMLHARSLGIIEGKIDILRGWAKSRGDVQMFEPRAGANALVKMPRGVDTMKLCNRLAKEKGVMVDPGELFGIPGFVRISLMEKPAAIKAGLEALDALLA